MALVEVVRLPGTPQSIIDAAIGVVKRQGKTPIVCEDTPGFVVNALLVPYLASAMTLLDKGVAAASDIDVSSRLTTRPFHALDSLRLYHELGAAGCNEARRGPPYGAPPPRGLRWSRHVPPHPLELVCEVPRRCVLPHPRITGGKGEGRSLRPQNRAGILQVEGQQRSCRVTYDSRIQQRHDIRISVTQRVCRKHCHQAVRLFLLGSGGLYLPQSSSASAAPVLPTGGCSVCRYRGSTSTCPQYSS